MGVGCGGDGYSSGHVRGKRSSGSGRLAFAGFLVIAVAFGPARNGFGLFLPQIREDFGLSTAVVGLIAGGVYAGYLAGLCAAAVLAARFGPRPPVVAGALSAAGGMTLVAGSQSTGALAAGVALAASSAGWTWAPYNDAVEDAVPPGLRARVLSVVSTGTTVGIAAAGVTALFAGEVWRAGWLVFAAAAVVALICNVVVLPSKAGNDTRRWPGVRWFFQRRAAPLFGVAASFGVVSSVYWSFAVDHVSRNGESSLPLDAPLGALLFIVLGLGGVAGFFTGDAVNRFGLNRVLKTTLLSAAVAAALLGVAPGLWPVVAVSALLFGAYVMTMAALLSVWSSLVFPERPSMGFSVALIVFAVGSILAPASTGILAGAYGYGPVFLGVGVIAAFTALIAPAKERPGAG